MIIMFFTVPLYPIKTISQTLGSCRVTAFCRRFSAVDKTWKEIMKVAVLVSLQVGILYTPLIYIDFLHANFFLISLLLSDLVGPSVCARVRVCVCYLPPFFSLFSVIGKNPHPYSLYS